MYAYHSIRRTSITPEGHACITITCPIHILKSETCGRGGRGGGRGRVSPWRQEGPYHLRPCPLPYGSGTQKKPTWEPSPDFGHLRKAAASSLICRFYFLDFLLC